MGLRSNGKNETLSALLIEAGLTPRALARELNRTFGIGTVAETAPYHRRDASATPREPQPSLTAYVLTRRLGRSVTVAELWHGGSDDGDMSVVLPASTGMDGPWDLQTTMHIADDWLMGGLMDRRSFLSVSGATLAQAVRVYLNTTAKATAGTLAAGIDDPLVEQIEASVPRLQMLDDDQGGAAGLGYVGAQVRAVMLVLRDGGHSDATTKRLLVSLTDLAQLAGWKAFDAARYGLAQ